MTFPSPLLEGFLAHVVDCLRATVGVEAAVSAIGDATHSSSSIVVCLDFDGDLRGPITWVFPPAVALELVRRLMADPDPPPETAADGATELANILTGHAAGVLESHGLRCEFGAPRVHVGALPTGVELHVSTSQGPIDIVLPSGSR